MVLSGAENTCESRPGQAVPCDVFFRMAEVGDHELRDDPRRQAGTRRGPKHSSNATEPRSRKSSSRTLRANDACDRVETAIERDSQSCQQIQRTAARCLLAVGDSGLSFQPAHEPALPVPLPRLPSQVHETASTYGRDIVGARRARLWQFERKVPRALLNPSHRFPLP